MDARALHKLHNAGDEHALSVADGVYLDLLAADVVVHQHRTVLIDFHGGFQIAAELLFLGNDLHRPAAEHEARAYQHGIADFRRRADALFDVRHRPALRTRDGKRGEQLFESVAIFRALDGFTIGADDGHTAPAQRLGQIDGGLPAEGRDDALRAAQAR